MPKRIVIAEHHAILRDGLRAILSVNPGFAVVGEARNGLDAIQCAMNLNPDLILMDPSIPGTNGLEAIKEIKKQHPEIKIIALAVHKTEDDVVDALKAGVDGYLLKDSGQSELITAIRNVLAGKRYISPGVSGRVIKGYLDGKKKTVETTTTWETLTLREREILKLIAEGYKNKEVADFLGISVKTVEKHRANLMKKLDLHNAAALTAFAVEKGLVDRI